MWIDRRQAMALEGGRGAHRTCIPKSQNQGVQGAILGLFFRTCKPISGQKFVVRILGGCSLRSDKRHISDMEVDPVDSPPSLAKRGDNTFSAQDATVIDPTGSGNLSHIGLSLEYLKNGIYTLTPQVAGVNFSSMRVIDSEGFEYAR